MKVPVKSMKIVCDHCGETFEDGRGWSCIVGDEDGSEILGEAFDKDWMELGGKHYCPDCYHWDDDDNIVCNDGRKFDGDTHELIDVPVNLNELKPGDVLAGGECIFIYKGVDYEGKFNGTNTAIIYYACTNIKGGYTTIGPKIGVGGTETTCIRYHQAYTDERELLFAKLREKGYEWNAKDLKLVKI